MPRLQAPLRRAARDWRWGRRPLAPAAAAGTTEPREAREFPTDWARSRPVTRVREGVQGGMLAPLLHAQLRIHVDGAERVADAADGPLLLAPNHSSHLDAPLVLTSLPREVRRHTVTLAASDYFFDAWWRATVTALVFNAVPLERGRGSRRALPVDLLMQGNHLLVFPEGTRSHDGYVSRFRSGVSRLAIETGAAIVPVAIEGSWRAMPRGQGWPSRGRPRVRVGFGHAVRPREGERASELTRRVAAGVGVLLDEQRSDWWTAMRNHHTGTTPDPRGPAIADWRRRWALLEPDPDPRAEKVWPSRRSRGAGR